MAQSDPLLIALPAVSLFLLLLLSCSPQQMPALQLAHSTDVIEMPETQREMRAVWIATVANIDWPSEPGLSAAQQKSELRSIFDRIKMMNMNTVIFQVRTATDALYRSDLEPWSEYLTGEQGKEPSPYYDPLQFAIEEAHRRGLEFHAWINPFRAWHPSAKSNPADTHLSNTHPHLVLEYGSHLWMDPGHPESHDHTLNVIRDIIKRYDVDAIHFDDYFYPYRERNDQGDLIEFPDSTSYKMYVEKYGEIDRDDWRRQNVDRFIERVHREIKELNQAVRFGISPIGLWQPDEQGDEIEGFNAYGEIYADSRKWFSEGWMDYFSPQLYWPTEQLGQRYSVLVDWWNAQNHYGKHFWPGNFTSRIAYGEEFWPVREITDQVQITRDYPGTTGNIHFSMRIFMQNPDGLLEGMNKLYETPALVPATDWIEAAPPYTPEADLLYINGVPNLEFRPVGENDVWLYVIKTRYGDEWHTRIVPGWKQHITLSNRNDEELLEAIVLTAVDKIGQESQPVVFLQNVVR